MSESAPGGPKKVLKKLDLSLASVNQPEEKVAESPQPAKSKNVLGQISMSAEEKPAPPASPSPAAAPQDDSFNIDLGPLDLGDSESPTLESSSFDATQIDPNAQQSAQEEIPKIIADRYDVIRVIGRGGMGMVLLAKDQRLERYVAIKRLVFKSNNMKVVQRRFLREAQTIASLGHVNIVNVFDIGQDNQVAYITMEYIPGPPLADDAPRLDPPMGVNVDQFIKKKGAMKVEEAEDFMLKLCSAMGYAHKHGTIHRDIKPSNILLTEAMEPKLVDFGLARPINISKTEEITLEGTMLGTPEYSAPEQWGDLKAVGITADIYALGGVFWFLLSARIPRFYRQSDVLPRLGPILTKAMAQKPSERYQDTTEFAQAILQSRGEAVEVTPPQGGASTELPPSSETQAAPEGMWMCGNCNNFSPETANYCIHCGASGWQTCQLCGADMKVGAQFCPKCGEDVQLAEESVATLLAAKNHANFLEYETALDQIKDLSKKGNAEAKKLSKEWHEVILQRRNYLLEFDSAMRVFNLEKAVEIAIELKKMVPVECLSENPDFEVVVKNSELTTELRKLLVDAATRAHEEHNLAKFTHSIQALNRIFGEDVCGAVNSQLSNILSELDQCLTEAGLALGMNCISRAMDIIAQIPPWKGGDLGDRRTRIAASCGELIEERDTAIDEIEAAIRDMKYSVALTLIRKMSRFRLPPDHSEMDPAPDDLEAHERIMRVDKVLIKTIDDSIKEWINRDSWDDIKNSLVILEQGESRTWQELLKRIKHATKQEIADRYNKAVDCERKGRFSAAARAWEDFLLIPTELLPPQYLNEAMEFQNRERLNKIKRTRMTVMSGTTFFYLLFVLLGSWMMWYPVYAPQAAWGYLNDIFDDQRFGGSVVEFDKPTMLPLILQLGLFTIAAMVAKSRWLHRKPRQLENYSCPPRMMALGLLAALSPVTLGICEAYRQWVYVRGVPILIHPFVVATLFWVFCDLVRGFKLKRIPANGALTLSWFITCGMVLGAERITDPNIVPRIAGILPADAALVRPSTWATAAIVHGFVFLAIVIIEHIVYRIRNADRFVDESRQADITAVTDSVTRTSIDFRK